ncbi:MAG: tetratricopeptide repeat protein [Candidatus Omnitrophota bacterium]
MHARIFLFAALFGLFVGAFFIFPSRGLAEETSGSITSPSAEHIAQIRSLHFGAEDLMEAEHYRQAIELYAEIILLEPDDETAYANMGRAYMMLGQYARAEIAFLNALHINPDNALAHLGIQKLRDPDRPLQAEAN